MSSKCFPLVGGSVMRATNLDNCGRPEYGECAQVVSEGFVSIATTANIDDGEEISVTNANGKKCVKQPAKPSLTNYTHVITFCDVEPDLYALITGNEVVYDGAGVAVGFRVDTDVNPADHPFALEVWSNVPGVQCSEEASGAYGYILHPFLQGGILGDYTIENAAVSFQIVNIQTLEGAGWGFGPYNVVLDDSDAESPLLTPIKPTQPLHVQLTEVPPPEPGVDCGCLPLDAPGGSLSTGADAGTPGSWTPAGSDRPDTMEELEAGTFLASPATVWSTGQFVTLGDGTHIYWDGTDWVEGEAP
jgi:hypothetical protein